MASCSASTNAGTASRPSLTVSYTPGSNCGAAVGRRPLLSGVVPRLDAEGAILNSSSASTPACAPTSPPGTVTSYVCPTCSESFPTKEAFGEHYAQAHSGPAVCETARRRPDSPPPRSERQTHEQQLRVRCPTCGEGLPSMEAFKEHFAEFHSAGPEQRRWETQKAFQAVHCQQGSGAAAAAAAHAEPLPTTPMAKVISHPQAQPPPSPPTIKRVVSQAPSQAQLPVSPPTVKRVVRHLCPDCGLACASREEAEEHWMASHRPLQQERLFGGGDPTASDITVAPPTPAAARLLVAAEGGDAPVTPTATAMAQLIESDAEGKPAIVRHTNAKTGATRTIVLNDDGTQRIFGEDTISSMMTRAEGDIEQWFAAMTDRHVRGLINELGVRLVSDSEQLFGRRRELESASMHASFAYFDLDPDCTAKDLDNVYRRLARSMHPDKNGGTEEAKENFQEMKQKYEELKSQVGAAASSPQGRPPGSNGDTQAGDDEGDEPRRKGEEADNEEPPRGAQEEGDEQRPGTEGEAGDEPPHSPEGDSAGGETAAEVRAREKLEAAAWKILRQLKMIGQNIKIVESDFRRLEAELGES